LELRDPALHEVESDARGGNLAAPMPGKIIAVLTTAGAKVAKGTPLVILEAMKMEHTIVSPKDGVVDRVAFKENDLVPADAVLFAFVE
jgi:3-methylcrotonyl-CoA carboxylase alpha subunit